MVQLNVWLDEVFFWLWIFVICFLIFHFILLIVFGRFKNQFILGNWPEHDERPGATPKWIHGIHMVGIIILAITGMAIRFPGGLPRDPMRDIHYFWMVVVIITLVWRFWYAFFSKRRDWGEFAIRKRDIVTIPGVLAYYGYFSNNKPHVAKYNALQKMSYFLFIIMMLVQAITGILLIPVLINAVGIPVLIVWYARTLHFVLNWAFIIMMTVHFYLAFSVDIPASFDFFGIGELKVTPHGEGHGGHGEPAPIDAPGEAAPAAAVEAPQAPVEAPQAPVQAPQA